MEGSSAQYAVRSISLPSRLNTYSFNIQSKLNRLRIWETSLVSRTATLNLETIQTGLVGLAELYTSVDELIQSPLTQKALLQHRHGILAEEALEGSIGLLDSCAFIRDLFGMMKEHMQDLQSVLRRKGGDLSIASEITAYACFRKKVKKDVSKTMKALKRMEEKFGSAPLSDTNCHLAMCFSVQRDVASITVFVFRSLLSLLSSPASLTKSTTTSGWSLISKLMMTRPPSFEKDQMVVNEMGSVDLALSFLQRQISEKEAKVEVQIVQSKLQFFDATIEGIEVGLYILFRRLIQSRVSLLNIHV